MSCNIHVSAERRYGEHWIYIAIAVFDYRDYGLFGFLANVRNYSAVPPLSEPRGLPSDTSTAVRAEYDVVWAGEAFSSSWLALSELTNFNYDQPLEDRRITLSHHDRNTCSPGEGTMTTYRDFLGDTFFAHLEMLKVAGAERIVFWFD